MLADLVALDTGLLVAVLPGTQLRLVRQRGRG
jgi:hypothetical protein